MEPHSKSKKNDGDLVVGVVGPCASGKSTLSATLREQGFNVRHIAQEHSFVRDMWARLSQPDILIYLDVSLGQSQRRRQPSCSETEFQEQLDRLKHAKAHADYVIQTDHLTPSQVADQAIRYLENV